MAFFFFRKKQTRKPVECVVECQKITANHKKQTSQISEFSASLYVSGLIELISWICIFTVESQYPVFPHPTFPSGYTG